MIGITIAGIILSVIFVPFQTANAFTVDLDLPNVDDLDEVPTSAVGATFEVTIDVEAGELISIESIEIILDNDEDTVKRAIFDEDGQRTSGSSTLTRGNIDIETTGSSATGYGYGYGFVSDGTTFVPNYSYSFTYSNAFISGNNVDSDNPIGNSVTGIVGPGTITISGKLNTALMEDGVPHTLDVLVNTGTGVNPDHLVAPQLTFTTVGNSSVNSEDVNTGDDVETEVDADGDDVKVKFSKVNGAGKLIVHKLGVVDLEDEYGDIFTSTSGGRGAFAFGGSDGTTLGDVYDIDASSITIEPGGTYTITIPYDEDALPDGLSESDVKIFHYDEDADEWEDITTDVDTVANTVTGETDSLSPIAAGYDDDDVSGGGDISRARAGSGQTVYVGVIPESILGDNPLLRFQVNSHGVFDANGERLTSIRPGQQAMLVGSFENKQGQPQDYAVIFQVIDEDGITRDIGWLTGSLESLETFEGSRSWTPDDAGNYTVRILIWNSIEAPVPLTAPSEDSLRVT
ncbi:hypothetical protein [Candidatus Nitrososphaera sp. FF02]|uniref:hypothetical protein n=1 Tax=Candidatus Nitrososphaera sp. FF02 TaxID=3398226 RepID=UPI0039EBADC6